MLKAAGKYLHFSSTRERYESLLWILTLLFPAALALKHGVSTIFYLMLLLSIFMLMQTRPQLNHMARYMLTGFVVFILVSLLSFYNAEDIENSIRRIKKLLIFIYFIPIFLAMASTKVNLIKPFVIGACIGGFVLLGISLYQVYASGFTRAVGFYNSIMFGSIAVIMVLALFISLLFVETNRIHRWLISLSLLGALVATIQSETRGAWLGLVIAVLMALGLAFIVKEIPRKRIVLVLISIIVLTSIAGILARDSITDRWEATSQSMDISEALRDDQSSVGLRLIMWDAAIKIWYRNPIIGTGLGDFSIDFEEMTNSGEAGYPDMEIQAFSYAHSTIFEALAGTGILGFMSLILSTFLLPAVFFIKALRLSVNESDHYASVYGSIFVTTFMIFGLTENWLAHKQLVMAFSILLAIMASRFGSEANNP